MKRNFFSKKNRIQRAEDFKKILDCGKKFHTPSFTIFIFPTPVKVNRLGISVSKKVGRAHQRNRIKRLVRELFRQQSFQQGADWVFLAKAKAASKKNDQIIQELDHFFINIFTRNP